MSIFRIIVHLAIETDGKSIYKGPGYLNSSPPCICHSFKILCSSYLTVKSRVSITITLSKGGLLKSPLKLRIKKIFAKNPNYSLS